MQEYYDFACTTPCHEPCAQLGSFGYMPNARLEALAYIRQLQRAYGANPAGTQFSIIRCSHDYGTYLDVRFEYDDAVQEHVAYQARLDEGCDTWDATARIELTVAGYEFPKVGDDGDDEGSGQEDIEWYTTNNGPTGHGDDCLSDADPCL